MYSHLVCSYIGYCKNLIVKYKAKRKRKRQGNCSSIRYLVFKVVLFFSHRLSIGLVLIGRTLAAAALYETCNVPIVKKYNQFIVFFWTQTLWIPAKWIALWFRPDLVDKFHWARSIDLSFLMQVTPVSSWILQQLEHNNLRRICDVSYYHCIFFNWTDIVIYGKHDCISFELITLKA